MTVSSVGAGVGSVDALWVGLSLFSSGIFWIATLTSFTLSLRGTGLISTVVLGFSYWH